MVSRRDFLKTAALSAGALAIPSVLISQELKKTVVPLPPKYNLPYKNTYNKEPLVTENPYRGAASLITTPPPFAQAKERLPLPVWEGHDKEVEMYWKAWEIAFKNIRAPQPDSGFVSSYIDTAYNGNVFMWDSSFITMFARYGTQVFPFQNTLNNFYAKQHPDGFICREIKSDGADCFERYDPVSTGPNLLPWSEMVYYHSFGDTERLQNIFSALSAYYKWLRLNHTWRDGTYWSSGWGTGMDNMPRVQAKYNPIYSNGHMVWLDTNLQQIFMANQLLDMGFYTERWQEIEDFEDEAKQLTEYTRKYLWSPKEQFLFDRYSDGSLCPTKGIGAFWALHTNVLSKGELDQFVENLNNPKTFNRKYRVPSLSADNEKYKDNGRYWQGGIWAPTNYMVLTGLHSKGYNDLAYEIAVNHYEQIFEVYKKTGTFFEYYAPESAEPGFLARPDFVGWTGLPPIAVFLEYILGINSDFTKGTIEWRINQTEEHGVNRYPFGMEGSISMICKKRTSKREKPTLEIDSNVAFSLLVIWGSNSKTIAVEKGKKEYMV